MSRAILRHMTVRGAVSTVLGLGLALPFGAWAQDQGGMLMELRLAERFVARDTTSPDPSLDGTTTQAITDLDFSFSSETRTQALTLDVGAGYQFTEGPNTQGYEAGFTDPSLRLGYQQTAAAASLQVSASATQVDLADVNPLSLRDEEGGLVRDLTSLEDGGTRRQLSFNSRLTLRDDAPFGLIFGLSVNDIAYTDLPDASTLSDSISARVTGTARFDINPVLQARLSLHFINTDTENEPQSDRYGINAQTVLTRPNGDITLSGNHADGDGGSQTNLQLGRSFVLPQTEANVAVGLTRASSETVFVTGAASLEHDFGAGSPLGTLTAGIDRHVNFNTASDEEIITSLSLASSYALTPQATLRLSTNLAQAETVSSGNTVDLAQVGLSLGYAFDRDWQGTASLQANLRDPDDDTATESTTLSLGVTRTFDVRR